LAELSHYSAEVIAIVRDKSKLKGTDKVCVVELDISNYHADDYKRIHNPDILIHLAWQGLPSYKSPHHFETELPIQYGFLKGLISSGLPSLVVAGSSLEYGLQNGALSEEIVPCPCTPYGYAKYALSKQLFFLQKDYKFDLTWARLFYMYGDGQPKSSLLPQLEESVIKGEAVFNMSGGEQLRDYLPVDEVAMLIVQLSARGSNSGIVNTCSGKPTSVRNLVEHWLKSHNCNIKLNIGAYPYPDYEPMAFWGDNSKLRSILNESTNQAKD
jgi:dTDP-6-deoxy-L-talose 4-dehydrogenase (NAD+)